MCCSFFFFFFFFFRLFTRIRSVYLFSFICVHFIYALKIKSHLDWSWSFIFLLILFPVFYLVDVYLNKSTTFVQIPIGLFIVDGLRSDSSDIVFPNNFFLLLIVYNSYVCFVFSYVIYTTLSTTTKKTAFYLFISHTHTIFSIWVLKFEIFI